jgi:hypothetical protein
MEELPKCLLDAVSFSINYNNCQTCYRTAKEEIELSDSMGEDGCYYDFIDDEDKQSCIDKNIMWVISWYPNSPVGHCSVAGSSLQKVLDYLKE